MPVDTLTWLSQNILLLAIPFFLATLVLEICVLRPAAARAAAKGYEWRDTLTSLSLGLIKLGTMSIAALFTVGVFLWAYDHRAMTLDPLVWWTWPLLLVLDDLCYYVYHRAAHRVRLFWCEHVNHHSSQHYNLSTALRQSTLGPFYGFVYHLPLALIGFHPAAIALIFGVNLLYQYWIHTEAIDRMPRWFEAVFNTPSHHRVHHGANPRYLDRNYGGIFIVWDRLFGSFEAEDPREPVRYGLVKDIHSFFLPRVIFHGFIDLWADIRRTPGWADKLRRALYPPDWQPGLPRNVSAAQRATAQLQS
jgi:sterol desaturase/sphingolipid hydroxylase (fatty acid hydroxylase superfamily)